MTPLLKEFTIYTEKLSKCSKPVGTPQVLQGVRLIPSEEEFKGGGEQWCLEEKHHFLSAPMVIATYIISFITGTWGGSPGNLTQSGNPNLSKVDPIGFH